MVSMLVMSTVCVGDMLQLSLVVAQHRASNNSLSGVQLSALSVALSKLSQFALSNKGLSTSSVS